jgi:AraC-like DNA-binding protein
LSAERAARERHQFITVEFSFSFLRQHLSESVPALHPLIRQIVTGAKISSGVSAVMPMTLRQQQIMTSLRQPPALRAAQFLWYQARALELMMEFFFAPPKEATLFCARQKTVARQRVNKVIEALSGNLAETPSLEELGRRVGCSHFYLSRTFSAEMGMTIPQYIRKLRMEKAAQLLKSGKYNVTEVALEVGYSSLSHFSNAFHETFGCCPGLYSLTPKRPGSGS